MLVPSSDGLPTLLPSQTATRGAFTRELISTSVSSSAAELELEPRCMLAAGAAAAAAQQREQQLYANEGTLLPSLSTSRLM